jgi:gliding motility-associated-like protein
MSIIRLFLFCLVGLIQHVYAQKSEYNWYFGRYAAINFETGVALPKFDNPQNTYGKTASISDPNTGKLLFYTDGVNVWNHKHVLMVNGNIRSASPAGDIVITPMPGSINKYYLFFIGDLASLQFVIIDMSRQGGDGEVITAAQTISSNNVKQVTAISHQYIQAYWIITHEINSNRFKAHLVDASGVSDEPVFSAVGLTVSTYGDMVGSNQGNKLAVTHYIGNDAKAEVFDFDRTCGRFSNPVELTKDPIWQNAFGIAFSPDDSKLYISYSVQLSQLVQYYGTNYQNNYFITTSQENFNIMRLGPDGRIYIATHDNGIPGKRIDAILNPNQLAGACNYRTTYFTLDDGTGKNRAAQFELPAFATGNQVNSPLSDSVFKVSNTCKGSVTNFSFNTSNPFDSLSWIFHDINPSASTLINPSYRFSKAGKFKITLHIFRCGQDYELIDSISINEVPSINFPEDTLTCKGNSIKLSGPFCEKYLWSTGQTSSTITTKQIGKIWLIASNGNCTNSDTILIKNHPDIVTQLGSEYFLCEDEKEIVKLDAGEGFTAYKWTPTNDTTQWIIVKQVGDYFVKVTDSNGCIGNDDAKVKRKCGVILYVPNVFTPNNDGNNDIFLPVGSDVLTYELMIYNRWGQLIFTSNDVNLGWDGLINGKTAASDAYVYQINYQGYQNKVLKTYTKMGNVTLLP